MLCQPADQSPVHPSPSLLPSAPPLPVAADIFCSHPHGILSYSHWLAFATEALGFARLFPGIDCRVLTLVRVLSGVRGLGLTCRQAWCCCAEGLVRAPRPNHPLEPPATSVCLQGGATFTRSAGCSG